MNPPTQLDVMARLQTLLSGMGTTEPGVALGTALDIGLSDAVNAASLTLEYGSEHAERQTLSASGLYAVGFVVLLRCFVGAPDTAPEDATANALPLFRALSALLLNDRASSADTWGNKELQGTAWDVALLPGENNLASYRQVGQAPEVRYRIGIVIMQAANA